MARVCRPGGRIGLANWTPEGFIGQMFKALGAPRAAAGGRAVAVAVGHRGAPAHAVRRARPPRSRSRRAHFNFRYRSAAHFIEVFRTWYGPVHKAFAALPPDKGQALERDLTELLDGLNRGGSGSLVVPSEYLEVVVTRR